jgi:hypothetical protein
MSTCNSTTTASSFFSPDIPSLYVNDLQPVVPSSSAIQSSLEISNLKISNNTSFDPGIPRVGCHKILISNISTMECDYDDSTPLNSVATKNEDPPNLNHLLSTIASQITDATNKMSSDFQQVVSDNRIFKQGILDANDVFKQEVRDEIADLRALLRQQQQLLNSSSSPPVIPSPSVPDVPSVSPRNTVVSNLPTNSNSTGLLPTTTSPSTDQVLLLLTESFTKMASALTEKQSDAKAESPKSPGDSKKFRSWYLAIMTQLSITPWRDLYDSSRNDIVESTTNNTLNEKLYSKLVLALEGLALQHVVSRKHLRANGLAVL